MRVSGVVLVALVLIHVFIVHVVTPIQAVNFAFIASRWANPFWRWYDLIMLGLGLIHGMNGVRVVADDYIHSPGWRTVVAALIWLTTFVFLVVGAEVILVFQAD
jgi:succinate dehydrogenase / fumarate reductase membrane anchor subunit